MSWWPDVPAEHPFGAHCLPYGSISPDGGGPRRLGVRVGEQVLDLAAAAPLVVPDHAGLLGAGTLDPLLAAGPRAWGEVRAAVRSALHDEAMQDRLAPLLLPLEQVRTHLAFTVADYVDFYASEHHATNLGRLFRPGQDPLPASWKHLPIGYHGRAGTVVVSGTPVRRPHGQVRPQGGEVSVQPSARLDIEAELGFVVGAGSSMGEPVPLGAFADHVFGVCVVNDWSARDLQAWEYVPLGPFLGKSFATSVSAWVVPLEALEHARTGPPARDVPLQPYLDDADAEPWGLDIDFEVRLAGDVVSRPPYRHMYWTPAQMLAHLTRNGASLRPGDLYASGTVSSPERAGWGSLIELTAGGTEPLRLADGSSRTFLQDGDEVVISATAPGPDGTVVGLGEVAGTIVA